MRLKLLFTMAVTTVMLSCSVKNATQSQPNVPDEHTAQNALDWAGRYAGHLPCADCEEIETELTLNNDLSYVLIDVVKKNNNTLADTLNGRFSWHGNKVTLEGIPANSRPSAFKVEENRVRQLDMDGKLITGDLAQHYILTKMGNAEIEDKRWQIIELNGKEVAGAPETHYMIFHSESGRLEAKTNCNIISCNYTIRNRSELTITQGISTKMFCPDNIEAEFIEALDVADNVTVGNNILIINNSEMHPLLKLKLVE